MRRRGVESARCPIECPIRARLESSENKKIPLECGIADGETRTRTGDTTIFSRGSTTGECGLFPATTRGAVAGLRAHTFPRFPRDCGVFGRRFSDLCLNSVAAERAQPGGCDRLCRQAQSPAVEASRSAASGRAGRALGRTPSGPGVRACRSGHRCRPLLLGSVVCLPSAALSAPALAARKPLASLGLGLTAALRVRCAALLAPVAALSDTQRAPRSGARRTP
jgi:hypothetical protein